MILKRGNGVNFSKNFSITRQFLIIVFLMSSEEDTDSEDVSDISDSFNEEDDDDEEYDIQN